MHPFRALVVAIPVLASLAIPLVPAEAHRRHDGGGAMIAGLLGLGVGALAGSALRGPSYEYEPAYDPPAYAPIYAAPPPVYYAPPQPRVVYLPPPVAYAPPDYYVQSPAYARLRFDYDRRRPVEAGWDYDD